MKKPVCYILSGLGADERVFDQIDFGDFAPVFIPWEPVEHSQSFESYVEQLSRQVKSTHPILIGISFGGIIAQEMSALFGNCPVLIISSIQNRSQLTPFMRFSGMVGLYKLIPIKRVLKNKRINYWLFGTKREDEKKILDRILADSDPLFTQWAIKQITTWKRTEPIPAKLLHIHGDADRIFRIGRVNPDYIIPGGTHFMTVSKHEEVSSVIREALSSITRSLPLRGE
ncbi:alpha/beta fold hydrolase [Fluviicola chungangensis]|uniref:Alpha/beta hydrolase n=1 Tax=Fluviicola chungangensis TaxID=2597671 RepID=A0A556MJP7_9FLAO|nr:alpha/beta hydrolase [Fluviicola chungangensis]TSJ40106.1 alpha/beta hydrolase [Fluviicola chungangensis]